MKRETFARAGSVARIPEPEEQQPERPSHMCAAHGCPMWGSISDQTVGEVRQRWCRFHFGEGGRHLDAITTALRRNMRLVDEEQRLRGRIATHSADPDDRPALIELEKKLGAAVQAGRG